ncbi:DCL family protein [Sphingomonas pokkalii]|nr:DCL family protein [Sphingomonas pokkalii]
MGKARRISLTTRSFAKAGDATAFFTAMLNRYNIGDQVSDQDAEDLLALLERHDEYEEKAAGGILGFEVNKPPADVPQFSKKCFWVLKRNGSRIDFSIGHCLKPKPYD